MHSITRRPSATAADGTPAREVTEIIEGLKPPMVRGMLLARIGFDATTAVEKLQQPAGADEGPKLN